MALLGDPRKALAFHPGLEICFPFLPPQLRPSLQGFRLGLTPTYLSPGLLGGPVKDVVTGEVRVLREAQLAPQLKLWGWKEEANRGHHGAFLPPTCTRTTQESRGEAGFFLNPCGGARSLEADTCAGRGSANTE